MHAFEQKSPFFGKKPLAVVVVVSFKKFLLVTPPGEERVNFYVPNLFSRKRWLTYFLQAKNTFFAQNLSLTNGERVWL